jgi:enediyne biosynthesis protein E4
VFVIVLVATLFGIGRLPSASADDRVELASHYRFQELPIELPPGLAERSIREVNPDYKIIQAWISAVGSAVAINDLSGSGHANDICLVDSRSDAVVITPAPDSGRRYAPFVLDPAPLPSAQAIAPMGCVPGDYNGDGRMDVLIYYWGRTPILFMRLPGTDPLSRGSFLATELVPHHAKADGGYNGQKWNSNAVAIADFDGDGHPDVGVFNYFPDSEVLNPHGQSNVEMNHSMSAANNGGGAHILRWVSATTGDAPSASYEEQETAIDPAFATGWTLGAGSADLDGDLLPELYLANDFGHDHFFHNASKPGQIRFEHLKGERTATTPKSMVLGNDSFKGMATEFGDLQGRGCFDIFVSNISTAWGLEESNFVWVNNAKDAGDARTRMNGGVAPFTNEASNLNLAWVGWGWDAKIADFNNSGNMSIVQTAGFLKGEINRWSWLQELAMANDTLVPNPAMWPKAQAGDDIGGDQHMAFWVREPNGRYVDISPQLGMDALIPSRGVAVADTTGDGMQDFAVARQWSRPVYYHNEGVAKGSFLGLRLVRQAVEGGDERGAPAYGAVVKVTTSDGRTRVAQLDGGSGHSGKRSFDVFLGLGAAGEKPISTELSWRDANGSVHTQKLELTKGWHTIMLGTQAQEVTAP